MPCKLIFWLSLVYPYLYNCTCSVSAEYLHNATFNIRKKTKKLRNTNLLSWIFFQYCSHLPSSAVARKHASSHLIPQRKPFQLRLHIDILDVSVCFFLVVLRVRHPSWPSCGRTQVGSFLQYYGCLVCLVARYSYMEVQIATQTLHFAMAVFQVDIYPKLQHLKIILSQ